MGARRAASYAVLTAAIAFALTSAGCVQPSLDSCDGLACPVGLDCVSVGGSPACVTPEQLTTCANAVELSTCTWPAGSGVCVDQICVPIECGNGRVEPGEQCDDGNTTSGDGCSSTCQDERCGNAIIDQADGETCDCGDGTVTPPPECNGVANSDSDPGSLCSTTCKVRRCGDGIIEATESCEGDDLQGNTCLDLGYYNGTLGCTALCTFDTAGCSGRCGDGIVDPSHEYCDGAPRGYCADFGFATGQLACVSCGPSFGDCRDATVFTDLAPGRDDLIELVPGPTIGEAWIATTTGVALYRPTAGVTDYATATGAHTLDISSLASRVAVSTDHGVYIFDGSGTIVDRIANASPAPASCLQIVLTASDTFLCLGTAVAAWYQNGAWMATFAISSNPPLDAIALGAGSAIYSDWWTGTFAVDFTGQTAMAGDTTGIDQFDTVAGDGIYGGRSYGGDSDGQTGAPNPTMVRTSLDATDPWTDVDGSEFLHGIAVVGNRLMKRRSDFEYVQAGPRRSRELDGTDVACRRLYDNGDGTALCLTTDALPRFVRYGGATVSQLDPSDTWINPGQLSDAFIDENDVAYFVGGGGAGATGLDWEPPPDTSWTTIAGRSSTAILLFAAYTPDYEYWDGAAFTAGIAPAGIVTAAADGQGKIALAILGPVDPYTTCQVLYGTPGASLAVIATLATNCPTSLWIAPGGDVWSASYAELRDVTRGTTTALTPSPLASAGAIAGASANDIWAAASGTILHWDGTTWTPQLTDPGSLFDWINVLGPDLVIASAGGIARTTWIYDASHRWNKLRLPSDQTTMTHPQLRPWGVYFVANATAKYAVWQDGWP